MRSPSSKDCAKLLKALSDEVRLQIIGCLFDDERSVTDIARELRKEHSKVSHHLGILRNAGIVVDKKEGKFVIYRIHPIICKQLIVNEHKDALDLKCCTIEFHRSRRIRETR
jgi:ArsR family transcriptional regulator